MAIENGIDKLRINPGNIGDEGAIKAVVEAAKAKNIPIRIGVNGGSLEKELILKHKGVTPEALFESAYNHIKILEALDFHDIIVSIKASSIEKPLRPMTFGRPCGLSLPHWCHRSWYQV